LPKEGAANLQEILDFISTTDVGRQVPAEEGAVIEVSEWELREHWGAEAEELGHRGIGYRRSYRCFNHVFLRGIHG